MGVARYFMSIQNGNMNIAEETKTGHYLRWRWMAMSVDPIIRPQFGMKLSKQVNSLFLSVFLNDREPLKSHNNIGEMKFNKRINTISLNEIDLLLCVLDKENSGS